MKQITLRYRGMLLKESSILLPPMGAAAYNGLAVTSQGMNSASEIYSVDDEETNLAVGIEGISREVQQYVEADTGFDMSGYVSPDILRTLDELSHKVLLGLIATGSADTAKVRIVRSGAGIFFPLIFYADDLDLTPEDPAFFHIAGRVFELPPHEILYVASNFGADSICARESGHDVCWYDVSGSLEKTSHWRPEYIVRDLNQILMFAPPVS